jgi:hypothetical protein
LPSKQPEGKNLQRAGHRLLLRKGYSMGYNSCIQRFGSYGSVALIWRAILDPLSYPRLQNEIEILCPDACKASQFDILDQDCQKQLGAMNAAPRESSCISWLAVQKPKNA